MATIIHPKVRPLSTDDYRGKLRQRSIGFALAGVGFVLAGIAFVASLTAAGDETIRESVLPWSFGLTTTAFGTIKAAIAVVLWAILMKVWFRADAVTDTMKRLVVPDTDGQAPTSTDDRVEVTDGVPDELPIHRMAKRMWAPMLAMGATAVVVGLFISFAWAGGGGITAAAWTQGLQFLGEAMLLASISFLLGTILWAMRTAGSELQASLGIPVKTLQMPTTAKVFVGLMALGMATAVTQFVLYLIAASGGVDATVWFSWLGPLRELSLALILSGIAMALVTIGTALRFQFDRVVELIRHGR